MGIAITKVSSRGQVVIPQDIRESLHLKEGEKLLAYSTKDTILLKKIESSIKEFEALAKFGRKFTKAKGITKKDVLAND